MVGRNAACSATAKYQLHMSQLQLCLQRQPTHTSTIYMCAMWLPILTAALHMPLQYLWSIRQFNTAINIVRYDQDANPTIELLNGNSHLGELR